MAAEVYVGRHRVEQEDTDADERLPVDEDDELAEDPDPDLDSLS
jgi:hypothetical protein